MVGRRPTAVIPSSADQGRVRSPPVRDVDTVGYARKGLQMPEEKPGVPNVSVPLDDFVRSIASQAATEAATVVINAHIKTCSAPVKVDLLEGRLHKVEIGFAKLIGMLVGTGLISSGATIGLFKVLGG